MTTFTSSQNTFTSHIMEDKRFRSWVFYINIYTDNTIDELNQLITKYKHITHLLVVQGIGTNGSYYLSGYIRFKNPTHRNPISKRISNVYLDHANGTPMENYEYLTRDNTPLINIGNFHTYT